VKTNNRNIEIIQPDITDLQTEAIVIAPKKKECLPWRSQRWRLVIAKEAKGQLR
jgi:hypothetical protein